MNLPQIPNWLALAAIVLAGAFGGYVAHDIAKPTLPLQASLPPNLIPEELRDQMTALQYNCLQSMEATGTTPAIGKVPVTRECSEFWTWSFITLFAKNGESFEKDDTTKT